MTKLIKVLEERFLKSDNVAQRIMDINIVFIWNNLPLIHMLRRFTLDIGAHQRWTNHAGGDETSIARQRESSFLN